MKEFYTTNELLKIILDLPGIEPEWCLCKHGHQTYQAHSTSLGHTQTWTLLVSYA
jgi:hypothetical protein